LNDPNDPTSLSNNIVWSILEDSSGWLWIGTMGGGINRLNPERSGFSHLRHKPASSSDLSSDYILTLYEDSKGFIWIGTTQGLDKFDPRTQMIKHYRNNPDDIGSLSSNAIPAILEDTRGNLWFGTDDGLNLFDSQTDTFTHFSEKDGLANNAVACILEDATGYLWISTGKGISRFDTGEGVFKSYDVRDGLQSNEFNRGACHNNLRGEMFFGGVNGFNVFDPQEITDNPHVPPVMLTGFQVFNEAVPIGSESILNQAIGETESITLSFRDYVFSFEFAALDYSIPTKNHYAYWLEGFDKDWVYVDSSRRFASYANIPAGTYTFRVKGSNNDGIWNENGVALRLAITPSPWKTWWAYSLYSILGISILAAAWRYRVKELERKHLEQTMWAVQSERDRVARLLEARRQLVASISHDLRTPVAIARAHLESLPSTVIPGHFQGSNLEVISQELERLQIMLDDLFTLSRLEVDRLKFAPSPVDVIKVAHRAVDAIAFPAWQQGKVEVSFQADSSELCVMVDEQRLIQILMNLLHNAVRHTLPGGIVIVRVSSGPAEVTITVRDSGEGITPEDLPHVWERFYRGRSLAGGGAGLGLALVKELTEAMGGWVSVESAEGEGSCFMVVLPLIMKS
jgi:two-component system, sensor histidine kinase ChiS